MVGLQAYALLAYSLAGSLMAFLIFNHHPAKIFMGDSGSLMIGLVNAILVIKFINVASEPSVALPIESAAAIGFAILIVPLLDTLRVFAIRIFNGRSPFTPDRNHVHHLLLGWGLGHTAVTVTCVAINISFVMLAYMGRSMGPTSLLLIMLTLSFAGLGLLYYPKPLRTMVIAKSMSGPAESSRAMSLTSEILRSPALEDLAELFRVAIGDAAESVSLAEEVELAQRYLDIEQARFGSRLHVSWELDPEAGSARVPPLLLQPLVENAVRHGVEPSAEGGVIRIRTKVKVGRAVVSIANSVPKEASRPGSGMALKNVRERLRLMHDVAAQFETRQEADVFRVQIVVPL
jgi:hypothetical protein